MVMYMNKNVGILCDELKLLDKVYKDFPNNTYVVYYNKISNSKVEKYINFFKLNDCYDIYYYSKDDSVLRILKTTYVELNFYNNVEQLNSYKKDKKIILFNASNKMIKNHYLINYNDINTFRKDAKPKDTIAKIKNILKSNNYKYKETGLRRSLNGIYSIRLELNNNSGANGKGTSLNLAKASAYAELMERLQSNMLKKKRISTNSLSRDINLYLPLLKNASDDFVNRFMLLDDIYFNTEKVLNIKSNKYETIPINAINCFCHTNGLASGNSFAEAVSQAIFEILERYSYQTLLNSNTKIKNINLSNYPLTNKNRKLLRKLEKLGYKYYVKDCSLGKYPVIGFLLFNNDMSKYTFTMAADYSLDIALSRCISEMMQGLTLKELKSKMLDRISLNELNKKYKKNYKSYNWLKCFNNNIGYLSEGFFYDKYVDLDKLKFKGYYTNNNDVLEELKKDIIYDIYVKDFNTLGFDTYRVYIPYITTVDCFDTDDLLINANYNKLSSIYLDISNVNKEEIDYFLDIFFLLNKHIKYDELIKPSDLFHINEVTDYFRLDFTSLLLVLSLLVGRDKDLIELLEYKINYFNLTKEKDFTYKIIVNVLTNKIIYDVRSDEIEKYIRNIKNDTKKYLESLNPHYTDDRSLVTNKKSLNI